MNKKTLIFFFTSIFFLLIFFFFESSKLQSLILNQSAYFALPSNKILDFLLNSNWLFLFISFFFFVSAFNWNTKSSSSTLISTLNFDSQIKKLIILFFLIFITIIFAWGNITNPNFWYDESGQFWIAKGLNHFSPMFSQNGDLYAVLQNNANFNMDPGGFSLILHYWTKVSNAPIFLRLLPYCFFLISFLIIVLIVKEWFPNAGVLVLSSGFILLIFSLTRSYAFELRPYSFEMASALLSLFVAQISNRICLSKHYSIIFGILLSLCLTSRYSSVIPIFSACIFYCYSSFQNYKNKSVIKNSFLFFSPILIALLFNLLMLVNQNVQVDTPEYVNEFMLATNSATNIFLHLGSILIWLPMVILVLICVCNLKSTMTLKIKKYLIFSFIVTTIFTLLSLAGKYPLSFRTRWDISIVSIYSLSLIPLIYFIFYYYSKLLKIPVKIFSQSLQIAVVAIGIFYLSFKNSFIDTTINYYDSVYDDFQSCYTKLLSGRILANRNAMPTIKYLFEYGPLIEYKNVYTKIDWYNEKDLINNTTAKSKNINLKNYSYAIFTQIDKKLIPYSFLESNFFSDCSTNNGLSLMYIRKN